MDVQYWNVPVDVTLDGRGHQRTITATCFACECLLTLWPACHGPAYRAALRTCALAMRGEENQAMARTAFIRAAREAHVLTKH